MNITLSADSKLVEKARAYAKAQQTSLNELVRTYLSRISAVHDGADTAAEFTEVCTRFAGRSRAGYRFDRTEVHKR